MNREISSIDRMYIHCTASTFGSFNDIDSWHKSRGFDEHDSPLHGRPINIGYHFLILNAFPTASSVKEHHKTTTDGEIIEGRPLSIIGAHVKGDNTKSIGIAYVGFAPTPMQVNSLNYLCLKLMEEYSIPVEKVFGHHEYYLNKNEPMLKTCPNFNMEFFRLKLGLYT